MKPQSPTTDLIFPDWPCTTNIRACVTTRTGGYSQAPYDGFNLGNHVHDDPETVRKNRLLLEQQIPLPNPPLWLNQTHSTTVINAANASDNICGDAAFTNKADTVCAVMTADCLPTFFAAKDGSEVAVAHAGWRGLAAGILEATAESLETTPNNLLCWLGPAIGPTAFEVGGEVRDQFISQHQQSVSSFTVSPGTSDEKERWMADIYSLAKIKLNAIGITEISGGNFCTFTEKQRFFSYRRDGITGRMASLIWIKNT